MANQWTVTLVTAETPVILNTEEEAVNCTEPIEVSLHNPLMKCDC